MTDSLPNFSFLGDNNVAGMARPQSENAIQLLEEKNIGLVVSLTEDPLPPTSSENVKILHIPVPDLTAPTLEQVDVCVNAIEETRSQNKGAVVHCMGGKARTGTILACWLAKNKNLSGDDALALLKELRPATAGINEQQEDLIRSYAAQLRSQ